jgi:excisionase family DNA binding protein
MSLQPPAHNIYNVEEAGLLLHLSVVAVRELIKGGELKASLVGRSYLVTRAAIDAYLEANAGRRKERNVNPFPVYEKRNGKAVRVA